MRGLGAVFCFRVTLAYPRWVGPPVVVLPEGGLPPGHRPHWCVPCGEEEERAEEYRWDHHGEAERRR